MNLICVNCHKEMRPARVGVGVLYHRWLSDTKEYQAFKIVEADIHACPQCHRQVVTGFGNGGSHRPSQEFWRDWERHQKSNSVVPCY